MKIDTQKDFMREMHSKLVSKGYNWLDLHIASKVSKATISNAYNGKNSLLFATAVKLKDATEKLIKEHKKWDS